MCEPHSEVVRVGTEIHDRTIPIEPDVGASLVGDLRADGGLQWCRVPGGSFRS
jgi:hypothetical protein